jgi:hypothetical protein
MPLTLLAQLPVPQLLPPLLLGRGAASVQGCRNHAGTGKM